MQELYARLKDRRDLQVVTFNVDDNWIVDAGGVARLERVGFRSEGDTWVDQAIEAIARTKAATN